MTPPHVAASPACSGPAAAAPLPPAPGRRSPSEGEGGAAPLPPDAAAPAAAPGGAKAGPPNLRDIPDRALQVMPKAGLASLLTALGEPTRGTRRDLLQRAIGLKRARGKGHVHGKTPCIIRCGGVGLVDGVHDGKRHFKCSNGRCNARWSVAID
ncbi:MAG: hypothetical protein IMZ66_08415 [Planctomycetes bacterium]|nr:hypothetical protein [Planctomycetota bacterium]